MNNLSVKLGWVLGKSIEILSYPTNYQKGITQLILNFTQLPTLVYKDKKNALLLPFARPYPLETVYLYANKARNSVHIINTIWTGKRNEVHI